MLRIRLGRHWDAGDGVGLYASHGGLVPVTRLVQQSCKRMELRSQQVKMDEENKSIEIMNRVTKLDTPRLHKADQRSALRVLYTRRCNSYS